MKNQAKLMLICFVMLYIVIIGLVSADLGTFVSGRCVNIRVLLNCTSQINLTEVTANNQTYSINSPMTNLGGQTYNYSFCNTNSFGTYSYSWNNPCVDCSLGSCGNSFEINGIGSTLSSSQAILYIVILAGLAVILLFTLWGAIIFPWENIRNEDDKVIGINNLKYVKIVLWIFVYLEVLFMVFIFKNLTGGYLASEGTFQFFNILFGIMLSAMVVMFPLLIFFTIVVWINDKRNLKDIQRGILRAG